jgi:hypothetical protein
METAPNQTAFETAEDKADCTPLMRDLDIVVNGLADGSVSKIEVVTWLHAHAAHNLRNYFAAIALQGVLAAGCYPDAYRIARLAYGQADAMLRVMNEQGGVV